MIVQVVTMGTKSNILGNATVDTNISPLYNTVMPTNQNSFCVSGKYVYASSDYYVTNVNTQNSPAFLWNGNNWLSADVLTNYSAATQFVCSTSQKFLYVATSAYAMIYIEKLSISSLQSVQTIALNISDTIEMFCVVDDQYIVFQTESQSLTDSVYYYDMTSNELFPLCTINETGAIAGKSAGKLE
jgi:hypothetical protein